MQEKILTRVVWLATAGVVIALAVAIAWIWAPLPDPEVTLAASQPTSSNTENRVYSPSAWDVVQSADGSVRNQAIGVVGPDSKVPAEPYPAGEDPRTPGEIALAKYGRKPVYPDLPERLGQFRRDALADPAAIFKRVSALPVLDSNGDISGYQVSVAPHNVEDYRMFLAAGLIPGDVVTAVNGHPVNNLQAMTDLMADDHLVIDLVRGREGKRVEIDLF